MQYYLVAYLGKLLERLLWEINATNKMFSKIILNQQIYKGSANKRKKICQQEILYFSHLSTRKGFRSSRKSFANHFQIWESFQKFQERFLSKYTLGKERERKGFSPSAVLRLFVMRYGLIFHHWLLFWIPNQKFKS